MTHLLLIIIYLAFISLGLPDSLLGSAWPSMYQELNVPLSYAGIISMIIAAGTIFSSLQSDRLTYKFGTGKVTAASVLTTAVALFGFSVSHSFIALCLWAIPYGLGAGSVDASLNNYVALHYESRHMSWLHCMWGVGASVGPYIMGLALTNNLSWNGGYRIISIIQIVLSIAIIASLPLWETRNRTKVEVITVPENGEPLDGSSADAASVSADTAAADSAVSGSAPDTAAASGPLSLKQIISIPNAKAIMLMFFCYCALEQTTGLWAASYMNLYKGVSSETAASYASMFFIGITIGRAFSGFITMKLNDDQMIRLGMAIAALGILVLVLPGAAIVSLIGLIMIGLGCAPIYPSVIHSTPARFGEDRSQAIIGVEMASAYIGTLAMPPIFGFIANNISVSLLPFYLAAILILMFVMHNRLTSNVKAQEA